MAITQCRLKELMRYDPDTGEFIWIKRTGPRSKLGCPAGRPDSHGHLQVMIDKKYYFVHRLVFLYMLGQLPPDGKVVDHINGDNQDNRWSNLRIVTQKINAQNRHRANRGSKSGLLGVSWCEARKAWRSTITRDGKRADLGIFHSAEKAHAAYVSAHEAHASTF
ncbi:HNH endonuclease [Serratia fonticola]|uniref:HNH endonuclease n=1 Tax=Serratia fonticola TaxID=47917 RepID=UPI0027FB4E78|nr:HNH endonuclease [Serratia fonticola]MDQ7208496.1 HNH endonuclease [Serratia fonticola]HBE9083081.1 HNH endonuclease [Serratia fonticola]HBE9091394.1 HNH endonuclease [Serratia fonticola]HBE9151683.1 HNH endonuclease [Serratia fonticola]